MRLCSLYLGTSQFDTAVTCYRWLLSRRPDDVSIRQLLSDAVKNANLAARETR
jgi:hypothetical protein